MQLKNTTLDDLAAVIGFSATLRLSAWFGDRGNVYIPDTCEEGQLLVKLIGLSAAKRLTQEWGHQHLNIPRISQYEDDLNKREIGRFLAHGMGSREIANTRRMSERRVQQICRELEVAGLIDIVAPKNAGENTGKNAPQNRGKNGAQKDPAKIPHQFFSKPPTAKKKGKR